MGNTLDHIIKVDILDTITVNGNYESDSVSIDAAEGGVAVTVLLSAGNGLVNMDFSLKVSTDGVTFSEIGDTIQTFTDDDGSIIFDLLDTNATFLKVNITHTAGSIDVSSTLTAQRRH